MTTEQKQEVLPTQRRLIMNAAAEQVAQDDYSDSPNKDVHDLVSAIARELCFDFNLRVNLISVKLADPELLKGMIRFFEFCKKERTK